MPLQIKKREKENVQSLLYRFKKATQESGILLRARETAFRKRLKNETAKKKSALRKLKAKKEYERKKKLEKPSNR